MDEQKETEEEMKERLRKEILDELNGKGKNGSETGVNHNGAEMAQSFGMHPVSKVSFNQPSESPKIEESKKATDVDVENSNINSKNENKKPPVLLFVCLILSVAAIFMFEPISKTITKYRLSKKKVVGEVRKEEEEEYEKITLASTVVTKLKYPVMHNDVTNKTTYYSKDKLTISDFSNNDILYNTLLDIYEGNMAKYSGPYSGKYCGAQDNKVSLAARYMDLRIDNLYTKKATYTKTNFTVPANNKDTKYVGTWRYDKSTDRFIYYGNCGNVPKSNVEYYDIKVPYEATGSDKNIEIYVNNYVAFAAVDINSKKYLLYSDAAYTNKISEGVLTTNDYQKELEKIVENLKDKVNKYKYTYTIVDCAYQDYCFLSGEWIK